jgi:hypothetical protein
MGTILLSVVAVVVVVSVVGAVVAVVGAVVSVVGAVVAVVGTVVVAVVGEGSSNSSSELARKEEKLSSAIISWSEFMRGCLLGGGADLLGRDEREVDEKVDKVDVEAGQGREEWEDGGDER